MWTLYKSKRRVDKTLKFGMIKKRHYTHNESAIKIYKIEVDAYDIL